jgi:NH3-dependent NAD+ synthetase
MKPTCGTRWCWACATTWVKTAFRAPFWACRAASTRRLCWRSLSMRLGADKVRAVMMPSPYTADISWIDAREMAERVKVRYDEISIVPEFEAFKASLPVNSRA